MKKFKFLKFSNTKKLRYIDNYFKEKLYLIFLPGFMSDIEGKKPQTFLKFSKKKKTRFFKFRIFWTWKILRNFYKGQYKYLVK